jgi:hypothetical protein
MADQRHRYRGGCVGDGDALVLDVAEHRVEVEAGEQPQTGSGRYGAAGDSDSVDVEQRQEELEPVVPTDP